jgi:hypothetical protein
MENKNLGYTDKIRKTCLHVHNNSKHVKINEENLIALFSNENPKIKFDSVPSWTSSHFDTTGYSQEKLISFICVVDALNFCFWPIEKMEEYQNKEIEYGDLVINLKHLLDSNPSFFEAKNLSIITENDVNAMIFNGIGFPLIDERTRSLNELGYFIMEKYNSSFENFVKENDYNCTNIVHSIVQGVSTFRDETVYHGRQIFFYKRAQILAADLYYALQEHKDSIRLENANELTMFADYRVPQILNQLNILEYSTDLQKTIRCKEEITSNSDEEIEIRASTVICVEKIKEYINKCREIPILSLEVDYILWTIGEELRKDIVPHHRTLTIFY